jgi:uncharacterized membrane protein SpoIIM required for sporulation
VILEMEKFVNNQRGVWRELETTLGKLERDPGAVLDFEQVKRLHFLYQVTSADLAKLQGLAGESELKSYLESMVSRGFCEIHETRSRPHRLDPIRWLTMLLPQTFRRRIRAFWIASAVMLLGCLFGVFALSADPDSKDALMPFDHLHGSPSERVAREESGANPALEENKAVFASSLMTHNIRVSVFCMAMGATLGIGTLILLFYNGVMLGAVAIDYIHAGQTSFLFGWLLPHGAVEIPAILLAGQAGLVLGSALLGGRESIPLADRLRRISPDLTTLMGGVAIMLVWAGIIEGFFSQYHEPTLPYSFKILFGISELLALGFFLSKSGGGLAAERAPRHASQP